MLGAQLLSLFALTHCQLQDVFFNSHNPVVGIILLMFFIFSMAMVLLNCLIAIMTDSATKV